tara:strand:- start:79 stop:267 length:189 start_codon:yes stop_codon:yes gene_type:complete
MYIIVTNNFAKFTIELSKFNIGEQDGRIFGPFVYKYLAEEWVDNHCGSKYWTIIKLNDKATD